jgi:7-cyano-7-deazaguanine synthase in queuosine biosynthesis
MFPKIVLMNRPTIISMFSGGLDSLGVLYLLLTKEEYKSFDIHVHHMALQNEENRDRAEMWAVNNVLSYLKQNGYRDFTYSESLFGYSSYNGAFLMDSDLTSLIGGYISAHVPSIKHMAIGMTKTDARDSSMNFRIERARKIFTAFTETATKIYPVKDFTKKEIWDFLPVDLRELAWSCRTPRYNKEGVPLKCGQCKACKTRWD